MGMTISGAEQVQAAFRRLGQSADKQILRPALRAGAAPIKDAASADAPRKSGLLSSAMKINNGTTKAGVVSVKITPSKAAMTKGNKYYYATSQEGGWFMGRRLPKVTKGFLGNHRFYSVEQYRKASVKAGRKFIPGSEFMQRAYQSQKARVEEIIQEEIVRLAVEVWDQS